MAYWIVLIAYQRDVASIIGGQWIIRSGSAGFGLGNLICSARAEFV